MALPHQEGTISPPFLSSNQRPKDVRLEPEIKTSLDSPTVLFFLVPGL